MKTDPSYLTTKEVAEILRVKERKVYDLAAADEIPHRRITGKLLFPKSEVLAWIEMGCGPVDTHPPMVLTGSHDPLLDWAVRESGSGLATLFNGSGEGLSQFADRRAVMAGLHIPDAAGWNVDAVSHAGLKNCVLIAWASRARGMVLSRDMQDTITCFNDLKGKRIVQRQPGAGGATFFNDQLQREGLSLADIELVSGFARTEYDAAVAIAAGQADAAPGIKAMAQQFNLGFLPLVQERFDLVITQRAYFSPEVQKLFHFARTVYFQAKADALGGYNINELGTVRWLSQ